jgi:hypothetical protein
MRPSSCSWTRQRSRLDQVRDPLVVERQILRELALLLPGEDPLEVLVVAKRTVDVMGAPGLTAEPLVVVGPELRQIRVAGLGRRDPVQAKLLYQPILEREMRPLDPALGLRRVGTQDVDVELREGAAELRDSRPLLGLGGRDATGLPYRSRYARVEAK